MHQGCRAQLGLKEVEWRGLPVRARRRWITKTGNCIRGRSRRRTVESGSARVGWSPIRRRSRLLFATGEVQPEAYPQAAPHGNAPPIGKTEIHRAERRSTREGVTSMV